MLAGHKDGDWDLVGALTGLGGVRAAVEELLDAAQEIGKTCVTETYSLGLYTGDLLEVEMAWGITWRTARTPLLSREAQKVMLREALFQEPPAAA